MSKDVLFWVIILGGLFLLTAIPAVFAVLSNRKLRKRGDYNNSFFKDLSLSSEEEAIVIATTVILFIH
jgi:hypothetical protein